MASTVSVSGNTNHAVSERKQELEKIYSELGVNTTRIFSDFMTKVAKFEELVDVGKKFLIGFHQGIEKFITSDLRKTSNVTNDIIVANWNKRLEAYVEAGCRQHQESIQNICNSYTCMHGLQDHLKKVEVLLDELACLMEDAICVTQAASVSSAVLWDDCSDEEMLHQILSSEEETEPKHLHLQGASISQIITMKVVSSMLLLDYAMQKNIVQSLNIKTSSAELESYCLMWDLHPYIDDDVMHRAWRLVPSQDQRFEVDNEAMLNKVDTLSI